jgi:hypothetical protein
MDHAPPVHAAPFSLSVTELLQARMARSIHGLPKVSPGPTMPNPSTPCGRATPKTASWPFLGLPARRVGGLRPSSTLLDTPRRTGLNSSDCERCHFGWFCFMVVLLHCVTRCVKNGINFGQCIQGPTHSTPYERLSLKRFYSQSRDGHPQGVITTY